MENSDIVRIIHDYNYNQERYSRNMAWLIGLLRDTRREDGAVVDLFTLLPSFLPVFDPSGSRLRSQQGLSAAEIENGTSTYGYQLVCETPHTCPITLETMTEGESVTKINRCGHFFKEAALRRWFENHSQCPVCRGQVS